MECVHDCLPFQHVKEPTRFTHGQNPSLIDLTFTNEEGMADEITCKVQYNNEIGLIEALLSHHENTGEPKT